MGTTDQKQSEVCAFTADHERAERTEDLVNMELNHKLSACWSMNWIERQNYGGRHAISGIVVQLSYIHSEESSDHDTRSHLD